MENKSLPHGYRLINTLLILLSLKKNALRPIKEFNVIFTQV